MSKSLIPRTSASVRGAKKVFLRQKATKSSLPAVLGCKSQSFGWFVPADSPSDSISPSLFTAKWSASSSSSSSLSSFWTGAWSDSSSAPMNGSSSSFSASSSKTAANWYVLPRASISCCTSKRLNLASAALFALSARIFCVQANVSASRWLGLQLIDAL